jgi:major membrane immunogen (membrane-anchored lipoprotein)
MSHPRLITMIVVLCGLVAACGNVSDWSSTTIANGAITLRHEQVTLHTSGAPDAVISATGDFTVDGKAVAVTPDQRKQLQRYYQGALAVREHGIATGKAGVAVAGAAISGIADAIRSGDSDQIDKHVSAKAELVEQKALRICLDLVEIKAAQNALAAQLPAFKPYAGLLEADDDDCKSTVIHRP